MQKNNFQSDVDWDKKSWGEVFFKGILKLL